MPLLPHDDVPGLEPLPGRYLRAARLTVSKGAVRLHAIAWEGAAERVLTFDLDAEGTPRFAQAGTAAPAVVALDEQGRATSEQAESEARVEGACVRVSHEAGVASVTLHPAGAPPVLVWRARGCAAAPAIAAGKTAQGEGHWVAWHHDVREDTLDPDIAKWIALRFVAGGQVFEVSDPMRDRDRDRHGEEQSFEFPAVVVSESGAVAIFGRGSHDFWRQDVGDAGWTERRSLSGGGWGSRGRRCTAARLGDAVVFARREKKGIEIAVEPVATGGPPDLTACEADLTSRQTFQTPRLDRRRDPAAAFGRATFFGDIQQHSAHSDGVGTAEEAHLRARHRYGDDFVALTDHESFLGKRTGPGEWEYLQRVADAHDEPGAFTALLAYEWTGKRYPGPGHKCVYLPERGTALVSRDDVPEGKDLVQKIAALGGVASPHHIGWTGCDEAGHDPAGQPVWEICSCHGCYEHPDHPLGMRGEHTDQLASAMLEKGHRFGFTASSDSHGLLWHHGESRKRDPYRTGLTAVQVTELNRETVLNALKTRRCYATSGVKILLDMQVDGCPMGSELAARETIEVTGRVVGASALERLDLVTEAGVVFSQAVDGDEASLAHALPAPRYVYLRAVQTDGEMAWASPVFIG